MTADHSCSRCGGIGQAVKRITRRRDGTISSVIYDLKKNCVPCKGTGLAVMERKIEQVS